jgi:hypothetical protein
MKVFGPSQAAARIESSKAFAKDFMLRHAIPTGRYASFSDLEPALAYLRQVDFPVVVKASGLAAGKGVIIPETASQAQTALRSMLQEGIFGSGQGSDRGAPERSISLLAFSDDGACHAACTGPQTPARRRPVPTPAAWAHRASPDLHA